MISPAQADTNGSFVNEVCQLSSDALIKEE